MVISENAARFAINSTKLFRWQLTPISLIIEACEEEGNSNSRKVGVRGIEILGK
jgi:hypothetical protein